MSATADSMFAAPDIRVERDSAGHYLLRSAVELQPFRRCLGDMLVDAAAAAPERVFLAERAGAAWRTLTYAQALAQTRSIGQALLDRGIAADKTIAILAENGIEHALLTFGAMHVGLAAVPISAAYGRPSQTYDKLMAIAGQVSPALVYVDHDSRLEAAARLAENFGAELVLGSGVTAGSGTPFQSLAATAATASVEARFAALTGDTIAKLLFTSGSTGAPKGVINTHAMLCANQQMISQVWPFLSRRPPVILDWLPWSHTFGGNHNLNMILNHQGTLYIDSGKPVPGLFEATVQNLYEIRPTMMFNVPVGYAMLIDALEADAQLRDRFFAELDLAFYAAAALPQTSWTRLEALSRAATGRALPMVSSWGLTETAPAALMVHFPIDRAGIIGVPTPGCEIRLAPVDHKLELRVRGPHVTPGYWRQPDKTKAAFDEDGFYLTGDAGRFFDPDDPSKGLVFDGRLAENFKLLTGTWVNVGTLRVSLLAALAPLAADVVIAGEGRNDIGLLIFPNLPACRALAGETEDVLAAPAVAAAFAAALRRHNEACGHASSLRAARALLLAQPPTLEAGEMTDKGYINQRAVLRHRAADVARLYEEPAGAGVISLE